MMQDVQSFFFFYILIVLTFQERNSLYEDCTGHQTTIWLYQNGHCQDVGFCQYLQNCTTWYGNLIVKCSLMESDNTIEPHFPNLREITGYLVISIYCQTIFDLFPALSVIRGDNLLGNYALIIYYNDEMKQIYFPSLTTILHGGVRIARNSRLCYVKTIRWKSIVKDIHQTEQYGIVLESNKVNCDSGCLKDHCYPAPGHDNNPKAQYCWGPGPGKPQRKDQCQRFCNIQCGYEGCLDGSDSLCCHSECLGGCSKLNSTNSCHACKNYRVKSTGECVSQCPKNLYLINKLLCQESCPGWSANSTVSPHYSLDGECVMKCPANYVNNEKTRKCKKCKPKQKCDRVCTLKGEMENGVLYEGVTIRVPSDIYTKGLDGCTTIIGSLTFQLQEGTGKAEDSLNALKSLKILEGHIRVQKSSLKSLDFLSNLEVIKTPRDALLHNKYVMAVYENSRLSELWSGNGNVTVNDGAIFFQYNPRLCPQHIFDLQDQIKYKNGSKVVGEISTQNNGNKVSCETQKLGMHVEEFVADIFSLSFLEDSMICLDVKCVKVSWNFTMTSASKNILFYAIYFKELRLNQEAIVQLDNECQDADDWNVITVDKPVISNLEYNLQTQSKVIQKLTPYTRYAFYIKEIVSKGEERASEVQYINISQALPSAPLGMEASALSEDKIQLQWRAPDKPNGIIIAYHIYYNKVGYSFWKEQQTLDWCSRDTNVAEVPYSSKKLTNNQVCNINFTCVCDAEKEKSTAVKADRDAHNFNVEFQDRINQVLFTKKKRNEAEDEVHTNNTFSNIHTTDFSRSSSLPEVATTASTTKTLRTTKSIGLTSSYINVSGSTFSYTITGLEYFEDYEFKVCACTESGCTTPNSGINLECGTVQSRSGINLTADNLDSSLVKVQVQQESYNISWQAPQKPNDVVLKYEISIRLASDNDELIICHPGYLPTYLSRKSRFGNYVTKIRAISPAGNGSWTNEVAFKIVELSVVKSGNHLIIGIISAASAIIVLMLVFIICYTFFHRKMEKDVPGVLYASVNPEYMNSKEVYVPDEWELNREKIELIRELGQGSFGMVFEGIAHGIGDHAELRVAVKTTNENASIHDRIEILQEASIMKAFNCNHVVKLIGVVSQGQPTFVVMELMGRGDLKSFLKERRPEEGGIDIPLMRQEIYQMVAEIADGMAYLAARKFVHRDLAARNCMVATDFTVKIGDFGMTRDIYETDYYRKGGKGLLPVRWMAPESLKDGIFTTSSDVWSFGVVLWEISTLASQPYQGKTNEQVLNFVLNNGQLDYPDNCDNQIREFMSLCWQRDPKLRPSFLEIVRVLENEVNDEFVMRSFYHEMKRKALEDIYMKSDAYIKSDAYVKSDAYTKGDPYAKGDSSMQDMLNRSQNRKSMASKSKERISVSSSDSGTFVEKFGAMNTPELHPRNIFHSHSKRSSAIESKLDSNACEARPMLRVDSLYDNYNAFSENMQYGDTPVGKSDQIHPEINRELKLSEIFYGKPVPV